MFHKFISHFKGVEHADNGGCGGGGGRSAHQTRSDERLNTLSNFYPSGAMGLTIQLHEHINISIQSRSWINRFISESFAAAIYKFTFHATSYYFGHQNTGCTSTPPIYPNLTRPFAMQTETVVGILLTLGATLSHQPLNTVIQKEVKGNPSSHHRDKIYSLHPLVSPASSPIPHTRNIIALLDPS